MFHTFYIFDMNTVELSHFCVHIHSGFLVELGQCVIQTIIQTNF